MNIFAWLKTIFIPTYFTGIIPDTRTQEEKDKDYLHEEFASANAPIYRTKTDILPITTKYRKEDQSGTSECVPHGFTLALGIFKEPTAGFIRLSKNFPYRFRANFPKEGMNGDDLGKVLINRGSCLFDTAPTPATESTANALVITQKMIDEGLLYKATKYISIKYPNDIDTLCSVASRGLGVPIFIYATYREWAQEYPTTNDNVTLDTATVRHCVCILPNSGFIENGIKYVAVQDSAWFGFMNIRYLSEEFIQKRIYYAMYFMNLDTPPEILKPHHLFTKTLKVGSRGDEVKALQNCLKYEGLFPDIEPTGVFAGITRDAVCKFQMKYAKDILDPAGLTQPSGICGMYTLRKLNELFT